MNKFSNKVAQTKKKPKIELSDLLQDPQTLLTEQPQGEQVLKIAVDDLYVQEQVRQEFDASSITELGQSMLQVGQIQPIVVSPKDAQGYCIQKGERRWRAASQVGLATIDAIVRAPETTLAKQSIGQLIENIQREDLTPLELAKTFQDLKLNHDHTGAQIAEAIGKPSSYVSKHLKLLELPATVFLLYEPHIPL